MASFEYASLPLALLWGLVIFGDWPDGLALLGMLLIAAAGLFVVLREAQLRRGAPQHRRA